MKISRYLILIVLTGTLMINNSFAQQAGDYRSAASGNWSVASTWEVFDGTWGVATTAPTGSETITIDDADTVHIDSDLTITGSVVVTATGVLDSIAGSITFADGASYDHNRDGGDIPTAIWQTGSTALFTAVTNDAPANRGQDYYNLSLNTPDMLSNSDLSLGGKTIAGDLTVISSGSARWRLIGGSSGTINIMGDVIVQAGAQLETQGTGSATDVVVNHYGDLIVNGGNFSVSRGSQSSGTGTTTWNLFGGDFTFSDGQTRNSNPTPGNAKLVFAGADTQFVSFTNVEYGGGDVHFKIADSSIVKLMTDFEVNGLLINEGELVTDNALTFLDGGVYDHAQDGGDIPVATWDEGSTYMLTGIISETPGNRNQNFFNITLNTPNMISNKDLGLDSVVIGGDIHVLSSGSSRWRLTSTSGGDTAVVTIMGDLIVENGAQFETQGTGNALTTFIVHHYGNITVTDANFSVSRGSQGNGSGTTTWNLYQGDFTMSNGETRNSNPTPGNAILVFASPDSQQISFTDVEYGGGSVHFRVTDSTKLKIAGDFSANGLLINEGEVEPIGTLTFLEGATYEHARDGGEVPTATWAEGSTALFTGITTSTPGNRGQDYYNLTLDTPGLLSNRDMDLADRTIGGNVTLLNSGSSRWRLVGGSSGTITIMGDVVVEDGSLETQGTSSPTEVVIMHHGNIDVNGGTFAVSRGSQGGVGTTKWYLLEGNFSIDSATTRNSNPDGATFIFAKENGAQNLVLNGVDYGSGGLPIQVDSAATLNMGTYVIEDDAKFVVNAYGTLASGHPMGLDGNIQLASDTLFVADSMANFMLNGTEAQVPGLLLPDKIGTLTIANAAGVSFDDTVSGHWLEVTAGSVLNIDSLGSVSADTGAVAGTIINKGDLPTMGSLLFADGSVYNHARNGGDIPNGIWLEGSTMMMTGTVDETPGNRNQSYYNLVLNTPGLSSNKDMALDDVTIGGDIHVINSGSSRWRLTSASGGDTSIVTIMGDVIVEGGSFETQGTGNALTVFDVHHYGDVNVTGGTFAVSRGSQGDGSGSTRWYMHEGDFSISDAQTRNSNPTNAWFVFDKDTVQNITLNNVTYGGGGLPIKAAEGSMLDFGESQLGGNGLFVLNANATLLTANEGGVDSTIQTSGDVTLSDSSNYIFNGSVAQVTGNLMPVVVNNLTIDNAAGVTLSNATTINGILHLVAGLFDNTIPFTIGPDGQIVYDGGSLVVGIEDETLEIPKKFALYQNYPNPFNPITTIRYDVPKLAQVSIKVYDIVGREVAQLVNTQQSPGTYSVVWDAANYASGLYYYRIEAADFVSVKKLILVK